MSIPVPMGRAPLSEDYNRTSSLPNPAAPTWTGMETWDPVSSYDGRMRLLAG
jgi:hypothetical protein